MKRCNYCGHRCELDPTIPFCSHSCMINLHNFQEACKFNKQCAECLDKLNRLGFCENCEPYYQKKKGENKHEKQTRTTIATVRR